jgi:SpoVK/Ycf46/Vps4 family AAA+-type ATPase
MPSHKRKRPEFFDPNKSDSDDVDYVSGQDRPRKASRKSRTKSKGASSKKKRTKYRGSDVDDDDLSDSLLDDSFSEPEEEEDMDVDPVTGRVKRKAAKKSVNYEEPPSDEDLDEDSNSQNSDEDIATPQKKIKMVKLKISTPAVPARTTRAGSTARSRGRASVEPTSAPPTRRSTRARSEVLDEPLLALTNSGNHVQVIRGSESPETAVRLRSTRGGKGLKKPIEVVQEVSQEERHEAEQDEEMAEADAQVEEADEDEEKEREVADSQAKKVGEQPDSDGDELEGNTPQPPAAGGDADEDDDDDDMPVVRSRTTRASTSAATNVLEEVEETSGASRRLTRRAAAKKAKGSNEQSSDFEPVEDSGEEDISASDASPKKSKGDDDTDSSPRGRKSARGKSKSARSSRRRVGSDDDEEDELDRDELLEEAQELKANSRRRPQRHKDPEILYEPAPRRSRKPVDYRIKPMDQIYAADEDLEDAAPSPTRRSRGGRGGASQPWERNLHTTYGPFGGGGGPAPVIGGPWGTGATGGVDSDSSEDENLARPNVGGNVGMTPTSAMPGGLLPGIGQTNPSDPITALGGTPANLGKIKSQKALADADPLGVDQNVDFSKVGGLQGHIDQLKEMVQMPLLYPELFLKFHVTPPRGVLFHGPPGTGKTLLARALAAQVGSGGRKITFYMRKGADALSKWVGEAERQLRLLFEEARKTQPSIIFFDEIDGLAPVRSSKQEQIHASIVSTLLALMDGMDGRGQVIVIGATNRPDNIDPALRRPGRFDREFYFPLPDIEGRRSIIDIHTKDWGIDDSFKDSLAHATKGYGGADLRALCTEAALNSFQRTYPQIYSSNEKLVVDVDKIKITAKDFMLSIKKMIPSSERSTSSGAAPLPKIVEPLLRDQVKEIEGVLDGLIPSKKKTTALQEALYEQYDDADSGFNRETLQQEFEKSRVFRPRLLIGGEPGMGQAYIGAALLDHFEGLHVQNFDLPTIYSDSTRSAETAIVQLFQEVRRHKPSVIYLPGIDNWYHTLSESAITTFVGLLNGLPPTDPVLVLGITNEAPDKVSRDMLRDLFGFSKKNRFLITRPSRVRYHILSSILLYSSNIN